MYDRPNVLGRREPSDALLLRARLRRFAKILLAAITVLGLGSVGGAQFYAAPILVPALLWATVNSRAWSAAFFILLAALLMAEVGWLVAYTNTGESQPLYAFGPALGFVSTVVVFVLTRRWLRRRQEVE